MYQRALVRCRRRVNKYDGVESCSPPALFEVINYAADVNPNFLAANISDAKH